MAPLPSPEEIRNLVAEADCIAFEQAMEPYGRFSKVSFLRFNQQDPGFTTLGTTSIDFLFKALELGEPPRGQFFFGPDWKKNRKEMASKLNKPIALLSITMGGIIDEAKGPFLPEGFADRKTFTTRFRKAFKNVLP